MLRLIRASYNKGQHALVSENQSFGHWRTIIIELGNIST